MRRIEIHVVGYKQIEKTISVIVQKTAASSPAVFGSRHAGLFGHVGEGAVTVVVVEDVVAKIGDEQIVETVIIVIAHAAALPPAGARQAGLFGDVGKGAVAIVAKQIAGGMAIPQGWIEAGSVHQKNVEPAIVVVVEQRHAAAHLFEQELLVVRAAGNVPGVGQAGLGGDVGEDDGRRRFGRQQKRGSQRERQCCPAPAQHLQEFATRLRAAEAATHAGLRAVPAWARDWQRCAAFSRVRWTPCRGA